jgi:hypothetical protein
LGVQVREQQGNQDVTDNGVLNGWDFHFFCDHSFGDHRITSGVTTGDESQTK